MNIKSYIREVPDWPIEGVSFKDITTLLQDSNALKYVIDKSNGCDKSRINVIPPIR